jgi:hypothetical protein
MEINNVVFWYHPLTGGSGVQYLIEHYFNNQFKLYNKDIVDTTKKNIIVFFWETKNDHTINFEFKTNKPEFFQIIEEMNDLGFYFLADYSTESNSFVDEERVQFISKLKEIGINLSKFYLVTNNSDINLGKSKYGEHLINYVHFPQFLSATPLEMNKYISDLETYKTNHPTKNFLCLNRRVHKHKFNFLKKLWKRGLLEKTNWTWVCNYINLKDYEDDDFVKYLGININDFQSIQLDNDVMYGTKLDKADEFLYTINPSWFYNSKINLVVESNPFNRPLHLTEKTFKPIFLGVPFVIFASKGHLDKLKEFGFDVFESIIGKYDCTNEDSVIDAGIKLSKVYNDESVIQICEYNQKKLNDYGTHKQIIKKYFINRFETKII